MATIPCEMKFEVCNYPTSVYTYFPDPANFYNQARRVVPGGDFLL